VPGTLHELPCLILTLLNKGRTTMRHRKVKKLAQIYIPSKWQTRDVNPGDRTLDLVLYVTKAFIVWP